MKKTLLMATTAIISAFALEAKAAGYDVAVDLEATAKLVAPVSATCSQKLDFGTLAFESGKTFKVGTDGSFGGNSNYMMQFGTPKVGKVQITTLSGASIASHLKLVLPASIPMTTDNGSCGSVGQLEQAQIVNTGSNSYEIAFGGVYTAGGTLMFNDERTCTGHAEATVVYQE